MKRGLHIKGGYNFWLSSAHVQLHIGAISLDRWCFFWTYKYCVFEQRKLLQNFVHLNLLHICAISSEPSLCAYVLSHPFACRFSFAVEVKVLHQKKTCGRRMRKETTSTSKHLHSSFSTDHWFYTSCAKRVCALIRSDGSNDRGIRLYHKASLFLTQLVIQITIILWSYQTETGACINIHTRYIFQASIFWNFKLRTVVWLIWDI